MTTSELTADAKGSRLWQARGGALLLGVITPSAIGALAIVALFAALRSVPGRDGGGLGVTLFLGAFALVAGWVSWKVFQTVQTVELDFRGMLRLSATRTTWSLAPGEIVAVRGDAYGLLLTLITQHGRIRLWGRFDDRLGLLRVICNANPDAELDRYVTL